MKSFSTFLAYLAFAAVLLLQGCEEDPFRIDFSAAPAPYDRTTAVHDTVLANNLHIYTIEEGDGPFEVTPNDQIQVRYTARTASGDIFNTSYRENSTTDNITIFQNLTPNIKGSANPLIEGLRKGLIGMKEGEKRVIAIPAPLGYTTPFRSCNTSRVAPCAYKVDPYQKDLVFDVELVNIF